MEMNVARMVEHLKWLKKHPQYNTRNIQVDSTLKSLQNVLKGYNEKRERDRLPNYPPLIFNDYTVYADTYGKCPEGYFPTGKGWKTGKCYQLMDDGTEGILDTGEGDWVEWPVESDSLKGVVISNTIHQWLCT